MTRPGAGLNVPRLAALAVLLTGLASMSAAQVMTVRERDYWAVVAQYVKGDRNEALAKIGAWKEKDLDSVVEVIEDLAKAASKCKACDPSQRFNALPLKAAILLHAQRDRADRVARIAENGGQPDCTASVQGSVAERLIRLLGAEPEDRNFVARFSMTISADFRSLMCFLGAIRWAEFGLKTSPRDPTLHLVRGLAKETIGTTGYTEPVLVNSVDMRGRTIFSMKSNEVKKDRELNAAREAFETALTIDAKQEEASLRLGRVLWRLGRGADAEAPLRSALNGSETAIVYLAHLYLGQCLEDRQDLDGAMKEYRAALSLRPDSQIGATAEAHILALRGDAEGAREVLEPVLAFAGRRKTVDPFWLYLLGAPDLPEALFDSLRADTLR